MTPHHKCEAEDMGGWACCPNESVYQTKKMWNGVRRYYCEEHRINRHVWRPDEELEAVTPPQPEVCICAAVLLNDGRIIRGHRHNDCFRTMWDMTPQPERPAQDAQGFMTTYNRFVGREEALGLQMQAGIESARGGYQNELYSEDLY